MTIGLPSPFPSLREARLGERRSNLRCYVYCKREIASSQSLLAMTPLVCFGKEIVAIAGVRHLQRINNSHKLLAQTFVTLFTP